MAKRDSKGRFTKSSRKKASGGKRRAKGHRRHVGPYLPGGAGFYSKRARTHKRKARKSRARKSGCGSLPSTRTFHSKCATYTLTRHPKSSKKASGSRRRRHSRR